MDLWKMQRYSVQMRFKRPHLNFNTLLWMTHGRRMVLFSVRLACYSTYLKPLWMEFLLKNNHIELNARRITHTHEAYMRVLQKVLTMVDIFLSLFFVAVVRELKLLFSIHEQGVWEFESVSRFSFQIILQHTIFYSLELIYVQCA